MDVLQYIACTNDGIFPENNLSLNLHQDVDRMVALPAGDYIAHLGS